MFVDLVELFVYIYYQTSNLNAYQIVNFCSWSNNGKCLSNSNTVGPRLSKQYDWLFYLSILTPSVFSIRVVCVLLEFWSQLCTLVNGLHLSGQIHLSEHFCDVSGTKVFG